MKRSFWRLDARALEEVSYETRVSETFGGSKGVPQECPMRRSDRATLYQVHM